MRWLTMEQVLEKVGLSRSTVLRLEKDKQFPPHIQKKGVNLWVEGEIDTWMEAEVAAYRTEEGAKDVYRT